MKKSSIIILLFFILTACGYAGSEPSSTSSVTLTASETTLPTHTPSPTSTITPTPTITLTSTTAVISIDNIQELSLIKSWGKNGTFATIQDFVISPKGKYLAISGEIDGVMTTVIYETNNFGVIASYPNLDKPAWSADESKFAMVNGAAIELWDIQTNQLEEVIEEFTVPIYTLAMEDENIAAIDIENNLKILDISTMAEVFNLKLPEKTSIWDEVKIEWSPGGNYLAIIGIDEVVRIWDGEKIHELNGHLVSANNISWSPDGELLATSANEPNVFIWRMSNFNMINKILKKYWAIVSWSPDGRLFAIVDAAGTVNIHNATTGNLKSQFFNSQSPNSISWSPDSRLIFVDCIMYCTKVFDVITQNELVLPEDVIKDVNNHQWLPGGQSILLSNKDACVQLLNLETGELTMIIDPEIGAVISFSYSPNEKMIALSESGGSVKIINSDDKHLLTLINENLDFPMTHLAWASDNSMLAMSNNKAIYIYNVQTGERIQKLEYSILDYVNDLAWSPIDSNLLIGDRSGKLFLWNADSGNFVNLNEIYGNSLVNITWSQDGKKVAIVGGKGVINVFETLNWKIETFKQFSSDYIFLADLAFLPDGKSIFLSNTGSNDFDDTGFSKTHYLIWDFLSQETLYEWDGDFASSVALSPEGTLLAASNGDIWDLATIKLIKKLEVSNGAWDRSIVTWSPDGKKLIFSYNSVDYWGIVP